MSGPPPPPPPPGPPPPPAMAPPQMSKSDQHGRSALLTDITKGAKLKSAKHLMSDRSGLQNNVGGNAASNKAELICFPVPAPRSSTVGYSNSFSGVGSTTARHPPSVPQRPTAPHHHHQSQGSSTTIQHSRSLREKPLGPPPPPPPPPSCSSSSWSPSSSALHNGGRQPNTGGGGGGASGAGTVRNPPAGLGDLFGGGMPKLKSTGSGTVGRSTVSRGSDRMSNGSVDFPPPPPPTNKPSLDFSDGASSTVGRSSGSRVSTSFPPPPSPSQMSRPLPSVPGSRPPGPPPPPMRAPPPPRSNENGTATHGYNNRALPQTPGLPPKPPERKDSVGPPPPPFRAAVGPPPPPNRVPPFHAPLPVRPPVGVLGRSGPSTGPPPPPPGPMRATAAPPPPPQGRPPGSVNRTNSMASPASEFEAMFQFKTDFPHPDPFSPSNKTYPSQNPNRKASTNGNRRPVPPPPPPGGS